MNTSYYENQLQEIKNEQQRIYHAYWLKGRKQQRAVKKINIFDSPYYEEFKGSTYYSKNDDQYSKYLVISYLNFLTAKERNLYLKINKEKG